MIPITRRPESIDLTEKLTKRKPSLVAAMNNKTCVSKRKLAHKFDVTQSCIQKTLKLNDIMYFNRRKELKATEKQNVNQRE